MTTFYFIRHGEPDWKLNEQYKLRGHGRDLVPLTLKGIEQVYEAAQDERLRKAQIIVSSPYTRDVMEWSYVHNMTLKIYHTRM
ncbi:histidine phosphatase family protein [Paenibacillus sp. sgz500958]|uniref:histidine phosphatase family protein n=1 Tax=Paenibacillus sp. sgz500958 TaxID=3242475 RepID=UPI0036D2C570